MAIDLGFESLERDKSRNIDRNDEVPGIGRTLVVGIEIDNIAAESGAVEHAGDEAEHQSQPRAFIFAHRQQQAFMRAVGVGDRRAGLRIDKPAFRHRQAALRIFLHRAVSDDRGCDIENERACARRHADGERIGAEQQVCAAPGAHVIGIGDGGIESDHAVLRRHLGI